MPESPPTEVWVDEHVTVRRSAIEGHGLIAVDDIPEGTIVVRLGGRLVDSRHLAELIAGTDREPDAPYVDTITIDEDVHLVLPAATIAHFGNHSCDPTMWHVSAYELATRRPVRAGEELTLDYGTNSGAEDSRWSADAAR
jgi:SET domain-containing protein